MKNWKQCVVAILLMLVASSGCERYMVNPETQDAVTLREWQTFTPEEQEPYSRSAWKVSEKVATVVGKTADTVEVAAPVLVTIADLVLPGSGTLLAGVLGTFAYLRKRWKKPLVEANTNLEWVLTGTGVVYSALEEYKRAAPVGWDQPSKILSRHRDTIEDSNLVAMPDTLVDGTDFNVPLTTDA